MKMIDPVNFTNFNLSEEQLQEYILFSIAVSGKNATTTAKILDKFLIYIKEIINGKDWFSCIKEASVIHSLPELLKSFGFGCYNLKSRGFLEIASSGLDLKNCSTLDLEKISGIGYKTSRFFILHTRPNAKVSCLDVHILRWMKKYGYENIPSQTPSSKKVYMDIEYKFLQLCEKLNKDPAVMDLEIWNSERGSLKRTA
jgi:thermostable 8-oxoguanine DNA glycosylase